MGTVLPVLTDISKNNFYTVTSQERYQNVEKTNSIFVFNIIFIFYF